MSIEREFFFTYNDIKKKILQFFSIKDLSISLTGVKHDKVTTVPDKNAPCGASDDVNDDLHESDEKQGDEDNHDYVKSD